MNRVNKAWWRSETKYYKFSPTRVRFISSNEELLANATKWRIVAVTVRSNAGYYIIEGYMNGEWKFLKNTDVHYSTPRYKWFRDCENAWNRCKKIARKFPEIKMNDLIKESGIASLMYGSSGYKTVNIEDIATSWL